MAQRARDRSAYLAGGVNLVERTQGHRRRCHRHEGGPADRPAFLIDGQQCLRPEALTQLGAEPPRAGLAIEIAPEQADRAHREFGQQGLGLGADLGAGQIDHHQLRSQAPRLDNIHRVHPLRLLRSRCSAPSMASPWAGTQRS